MKYFLVTLIIILLSGFWVWFGIYVPKEPWSEQTKIFLVKKGEGAKEISINLRNQDLIRYSSFFRAYALFTDKTAKLQAGEYELSSSINIPEIVEKIATGDRVKKIITIIEGWTVKDIEEYLGGKIDPNLEGYLFPDTYEIYPEEGIEEIVERMLNNFDKKVRSRFGKELTPLEIESLTGLSSNTIIMASLLEKEVQTLEDKKIVSGILWKRLENNMPLQIDATITYITGKKSTKITKEELKIDSPYNTYKYKGLPAGPICNPGLESIEAAIYPELSSFWFYLSTPDGQTIFSKTLKEHNIAKEKYLR